MLKNNESKKYIGLSPALVSLLSIALFNSTAGDYIQPIKPSGAVQAQAVPVIGEVEQTK